VVLRAAVFEPPLERARQLHLQPAAEAEPAGVAFELVERARGGERLGVERSVPGLAVSGDARRQRDPGARTDVVLAVGLKAVARAGEAVGKVGRAAAGRQLALDA